MKRKIGKFRHLMTLQLRTVQQGEGGGHQNFYHPVGLIAAQLSPLKPKEVLMAMGHQLNVTHRINVRYDVRVKPYMRLIYGKRIFDISSIVNDNEMNEYMTLYCTENQEAEDE